MERKKGTSSDRDQLLSILRQQAEQHLSDHSVHSNRPSLLNKEIRELLHQVQVQQIELDMQNEELKISNEELEKQRVKFADLFDLAPVGYFIIDNLGIIEEVNSSGVNLLDATKGILVNQRFQSFINQPESDFFFSFLRKMLVTGTRQSCRLILRTHKGKIFHAQLEGSAINNKRGVKTEYYIAVVDISERINAELHLIKTKERMEMAFRASATGTWEIVPDKRTVLLDNSSCNIYGIKEEEFASKYEKFFSYIHPRDRRKAEALIINAIEKKKDLDIEYRIVNPDNEIKHIAARGHTVTKEDGSSFLGTLSDITEKKRLEKETSDLKFNQQRKITAATLKAQENERKRISETLHDSVSQLLYGIRLHIQQYQPSDSVDDMISNVNQLIDQLIKETRNISFELAPSILNDFGLVTTIEEMVRRLSTNQLIIQLHVSGFHNRLKLDEEISIYRMVQELINNSIKHASPRYISIALRESAKKVYIRVTDDGSGFNTEADNINLNGSGISSIKNRLTLYKGNLNIQSKPGKGTTVTIRINKEAL